ncbi:MAG TPA: T9SS type A sorting domain-containing protein, partial [Flavobacteriales bacterium]|nr:T9SS type A sorting domain-containing protein [Flavobacteriales bacterium]
VTGLHPASRADQISIYPQPANDVLRIRTDRQVLSAQIMDANGRLVHEQARPNGTLDASGLANGTYVLQLRTAEGLLRKPFVVAR